MSTHTGTYWRLYKASVNEEQLQRREWCQNVDLLLLFSNVVSVDFGDLLNVDFGDLIKVLLPLTVCRSSTEGS